MGSVGVVNAQGIGEFVLHLSVESTKKYESVERRLNFGDDTLINLNTLFHPPETQSYNKHFSKKNVMEGTVRLSKLRPDNSSAAVLHIPTIIDIYRVTINE